MIDRKSGVPLYHQLLEIFDNYIKDGIWKVGEQLPTENELAMKFGVSKITVRQAMGILAKEGKVEKQAGRGTFVVEPQIECYLPTFSYTLGTDNKKVELLGIEAVANDRVSKLLNNGVKAEVILVRRLISSGEKPLALQTIYIPKEEWSNITNTEEITYSLRKMISQANSVKEAFESVSLNKYEAEILKQNISKPAIMIEAIVYKNNIPILLERSVLSRCKITINRNLDDSSDEIKQINSMWLCSKQ